MRSKVLLSGLATWWALAGCGSSGKDSGTMAGSSGAPGSGGMMTGSGGTTNSGGTMGSGGVAGSGDATGSAGTMSSGGTMGSGGLAGAGGTPGTGGVAGGAGRGATAGSGGSTASGGTSGNGGGVVDCTATLPTGGNTYTGTYLNGSANGLNYGIWTNGSGGSTPSSRTPMPSPRPGTTAWTSWPTSAWTSTPASPTRPMGRFRRNSRKRRQELPAGIR